MTSAELRVVGRDSEGDTRMRIKELLSNVVGGMINGYVGTKV
ncbi:MAG: hypothetical protein PVS3B1_32340 [Ktedonobacteraceae bacterium]